MKTKKTDVATYLIELGEESQLFHDQNKTAYVVLEINNRRHVIPVKDELFRNYLTLKVFEHFSTPGSAEVIKSAINVLGAKAILKGPCIHLNNRFANRDDAVWIDLADEQGRAVKITSAGWTLEEHPPTMFRRFSHQQALPTPDRSGDLKELIPLFNLANPEEDSLLILAWMVVAPMVTIPRPILCFHGPQGSAKTTIAKMIRSLLDPSGLESINLSGTESQIAQNLDHHAVPFFDNLSFVKGRHSDLLCKAVSGGGTAKRKLFTDQGDINFSYKRPIIMTGINVPGSQPDLLDRFRLIKLERLSSASRKSESQIWGEFEKARPKLFGGLLNILVGAMQRREQIQLSTTSRMADFDHWGAAVALELGHSINDFQVALTHNSDELQDEVLEHPVAQAILRFMVSRNIWTGTNTELLATLKNDSIDRTIERILPKSPRSLSNQITILGPSLRNKGLIIKKLPSRRHGRQIELRWKDEQKKETSSPIHLNPGERAALSVLTINLDKIVPEDSEQDDWYRDDAGEIDDGHFFDVPEEDDTMDEEDDDSPNTYGPSGDLEVERMEPATAGEYLLE